MIRRARGARDHEAAAVFELDGSHHIIEEEGRGEAEVEGRCSTPDPCRTSMAVMHCLGAVRARCATAGDCCARLSAALGRGLDRPDDGGGDALCRPARGPQTRRPTGLVSSRAGRRRLLRLEGVGELALGAGGLRRRRAGMPEMPAMAS